MANKRKAQAAYNRLLKQAGSVNRLAGRLDISRQAVEKWGGIVPRGRVAHIAAEFGLEPWEVRPDLFSPPAGV